MQKYKYNINNLDCANCARKIESELSKHKDLKNVIVNFNTAKLSYESDTNISLKEINELVKKIESDVFISEKEVMVKQEYHLTVLIIGLILGLMACFLPINDGYKTILMGIAYIFLLYRTFLNAIKLLVKSKSINENFLMTISCLGAFFINEKMEGMMVIVLYIIGKILEEKALNNSRKSIKDLLDIKQVYANRKDKNKLVKINVEDIKLGDVLVVKKGEKIPVDGVIIKGNTLLDTSALTGESKLLVVKEKDMVLSGSINKNDVIEMKATSLFSNSTVAKILELLESATDKKTKTETLVAKLSKVYTPIIMVLALLIIILLPLVMKISYIDSLYRSLTFLVISCPCAIAISVPLSYFTGIGVSSKKGILIKGSNYLDNLSNAKNIIFDKTGTLTNGEFEVNDIEIVDNSYSKEEIIDILVKGEMFSNHPIATSFLRLKDIKDNKEVKDFKEIDGMGISFKFNKKEVVVGNKMLCDCDNDADIHLKIDGKHIASITISDGIKDMAKDTITNLKKMGLKTYMFTGDKKDIALEIGNKLKIDEVKYEMLPTDKFNNFEMVANNGITIFVGDGINDAPVLKRADIGISMGGIGTSVAIEASDIVLMNDNLKKITDALNISSYTKKIIKENLIFAIMVKLVILLFSVFGYASMWAAVFADTGVTLLTILNTLRIMKRFK